MWHAKRRSIDAVSYQGTDGYIMELEFASSIFGFG